MKPPPGIEKIGIEKLGIEKLGIEKLGIEKILALALLFLLGCNTVGPRAVSTARVGYNEALVRTWNEQLLLNLVRLRYRDTPLFMTVSSVQTTYSFGSSGSLAWLFDDLGDTAGGGAGVDWTETPSVTYTPLGGEDFTQALLAPIDVETLFLLPRSGWGIDRVMRCCIQSVNGLLNAPGASGPTPDYLPIFRDFKELTEILRDFQKARLLEFERRAVKSAKQGEDGKKGDGETETESHEYFMRILDPSQVDARHASDHALLAERAARSVARRGQLFELLLGAQEAEDFARRAEACQVVEFVFSVPGVDLLASDRGSTPGACVAELQVVPRSLMGILFYLSHGVEPPPDHLRDCIVSWTAGSDDDLAGCDPDHPLDDRQLAAVKSQLFDWSELTESLLTVRSAEKPPEDAFVRVRYRGHWFYIADGDRTSKSTFGLLGQFFALLSGEQRGLAPVLTLDVGS